MHALGRWQFLSAVANLLETRSDECATGRNSTPLPIFLMHIPTPRGPWPLCFVGKLSASLRRCTIITRVQLVEVQNIVAGTVFRIWSIWA
ncbi:hypothetical protein BDY19DRAFT_68339 [Irpex rosettiformis]|uniref:Uncharacterized protein n=1 Tax=Irpex rosettiformis TaxID=378272 RepID=A0ACB8ULD6_9APHY|nr:hypothetical protein BDY19DRAFT_68339 [Irpex rosettiformis]